MKITFIDPQPAEYVKYTGRSNFEPLGLEYVAAIAKREGHEVNLFQQGNEPEQVFIKKILSTRPHMVAFTAMTYAYPSAIRIAKKIKEKNKNVLTVFGGIHVSSLPSSIKEGSIDFIVLGEGEYSFRDLIKCIENDYSLNSLEGIVYKDTVRIANRRRIENLDELPLPLRLPEILANTKINTIMDPPQSRQKGVAQVLYSRGCPYNCTFCASKNIWGNSVKWRSAETVVAEIKELQDKFGTNTIFFTDLTFNLNHKKVLELCEKIISSKIDIKWYAMLRMTTPHGEILVSKELLRTMKDAGCTKVSYGLENLTSEEKSYKKFSNLNTLKNVLECGNELGLIQRGYLIIGLTSDTKESLKLTKEILMSLPLDDLRISFLTPFPNTSIYHEYRSKGMIMTNDWERYTGNEPILRHNISDRELKIIREEIYSSFFNNPNYKRRVELKIKKFPHLEDSFGEFFAMQESYENEY